LRENRLMTEMHPVEIADGGNATMMPGTEIVLTANKFHAVRTVSGLAKEVIIRS